MPDNIQEEADEIWVQTAQTLNILSGGIVAKRLVTTFKKMVVNKLKGLAFRQQNIWVAFKSLYSVSDYNVTVKIGKTGVKKTFLLTDYAPDDKILFKVTKDWTVRIVGMSAGPICVRGYPLHF